MGTIKCIGILTSGGDAPRYERRNPCDNPLGNLQRTESKRYLQRIQGLDYR